MLLVNHRSVNGPVKGTVWGHVTFEVGPELDTAERQYDRIPIAHTMLVECANICPMKLYVPCKC